jgi:hypothetical protein
MRLEFDAADFQKKSCGKTGDQPKIRAEAYFVNDLLYNCI